MKGVLALPTISTPPGATVKLSGWDFASTIRTSAADAACTRPVNNATQAASRSARNLGIGQISSLFGLPCRTDTNRYVFYTGPPACIPAVQVISLETA